MTQVQQTHQPHVGLTRRWWHFGWRVVLLVILLAELLATGLLFYGVEIPLASVVVVILVVILLWLIALVRTRFRFRLSTLLLFFTVTTVGVGQFAAKAILIRRQMLAVRALEGLNCSVTFQDERHLAFLRGVVPELFLVRVSKVTLQSPPVVTDQLLAQVAAQLRRLPYSFDFQFHSDSQVSDGGLKPLGNIRQLIGLRLGGVRDSGGKVVRCSPQISDTAISHLAGATGLERLSLRGTSVTGTGLGYIRNPSSLRALSMDDTSITDVNAEVFETFRNLERLSLQNVRLSDAALVHIGKLRCLRVLLLNLTDVTDAGLVHLEDLLNLEELALGETEVTQAGVARLQESLPSCSITH